MPVLQADLIEFGSYPVYYNPIELAGDFGSGRHDDDAIVEIG